MAPLRRRWWAALPFAAAGGWPPPPAAAAAVAPPPLPAAVAAEAQKPTLLSDALSSCTWASSAGGTGHEDCSLGLLQTAAAASGRTAAAATAGQEGEPVDAKGRLCPRCKTPPPERVDRNYTLRADCGNHSPSVDPAAASEPVISFYRPAVDGRPETSAVCELNFDVACANAIYNEDLLFYAKAMNTFRGLTWDPWYCQMNGFLKPDIVALQHDFEGSLARAKQICDAIPLTYGWNTTMTLDDHVPLAGNLRPRRPTPEELESNVAWTCAVGNVACDLAWCAYTYCDKGDGTIGVYDDCDGWDPVRGMPVASSAANAAG